MMFHRTNQSNKGNEEEEDAYCNCHSDNSETRDEAKTDSPCCNSNQQQAYQRVEQVEGAEAVLGAGEAPAHHGAGAGAGTAAGAVRCGAGEPS